MPVTKELMQDTTDAVKALSFATGETMDRCEKYLSTFNGLQAQFAEVRFAKKYPKSMKARICKACKPTASESISAAVVSLARFYGEGSRFGLYCPQEEAKRKAALEDAVFDLKAEIKEEIASER